MKIRGIVCGLLLAGSGLSVGNGEVSRVVVLAGEKITLKASPEISFAPAHVTIRTNIEADAGNRAMEVVLESEDFYRSSLIQLDGDQAPRTSVFEFRGVPGGEYLISARLFGQGGEAVGYTRRTINVIAQGVERF